MSQVVLRLAAAFLVHLISRMDVDALFNVKKKCNEKLLQKIGELPPSAKP